MNQITLYGITGRTELAANEYIITKPAFEDHGPSYDVHTWRTYTIQSQEDAHLFHLTEEFWNEATDRYYGDIPNDDPAEWPFPEHDDAPYAPCEQACTATENTYWPLDDDTPALTFTEVTCYDLDGQPMPFEHLPIGAMFYDPFTKDICRKYDDNLADVVASDEREATRGRRYSFKLVSESAPQANIVYPVLPPTAQHLADGPSAQDLLVAQEWAPGSPADALLQAEGEWVPEPLATDPPQDHPEGWNAPASLPPSEDAPETQGIPVTYKVAMGNCYRLYHHTRQIAIVPNYAQGETIAQALAATFAGRLADFSMTLDFIEGATP